MGGGRNSAVARTATLRDGDKPGIAQPANILGHRRQLNLEWRGAFHQWHFAFCQAGDNGAAGDVA